MPIQRDAVKRLGRLGVRLGAVAVLVALGVGLLLAGQAPSNNWLSFAKQAGAGGLVPGNSQTPVLRTSQRYGSIVTAGDTVYAGSENGTVYALRAADGTQQWQHVTGSQAGILAVRNDTVLVLTGNDGDQLLGLQASTGNLLWQRQLDNYAFGVAVDESTIYISGNTRASGNGSAIHAFSIRDGTPRWTYPYPGAMPNPIVLSGGLIFAHLDHNYGDTYVSLAALRASDGQLLWSHPYSQFQEFAGPAAGSGIVYITTNEVSGDRATALDLVAFDGATGRQVWRSTYPQDDAPTSGPVLADGTLYVDASASVYALRASDGTLLWRTSKSSGFPPPGSEFAGGWRRRLLSG